MSLSQELLPQISRLAEAIARLRVDYPTYDLQRFFSKNAEKLKAQGLEASRFTDVDLVGRLGDFLETPDFTLVSLSKNVDKSPIQTDSWVLKQIDEILNKKGWSEVGQNNEIRKLMSGKPFDPIEFTRKTLENCTNNIQALHSNLRKLDDPFLIEREQFRIQNEL